KAKSNTAAKDKEIADLKKQLADANKAQSNASAKDKEIADLKKQLADANKSAESNANAAKDLDNLRTAYDELRKAKPLPELDFPNFPVSESDPHVVITKVQGAYVSIEWDEEGKIVQLPYWFWQKLNDYDNSVVYVRDEYGKLVEQSRKAGPLPPVPASAKKK
ncbi:MAG: hypothetical protein IKN34_09710, partial [Treponema sp.]|nr:hypothetical protein [Treponema sp.]